MKNGEKRRISVFIASPGDLIRERHEFRKAIDILNDGFADGANVEFNPLGWEDTLATAGGRIQSVINQKIDRCDVFILVMHRRWGQEAPDAKPYSSYTEEEFYRALDRLNNEGSPVICVFFKRVELEQEADAGPQLKKVLEFRRKLEDSRKVLYRTIENNENCFLDEVDKHLRAFARGDLRKLEEQNEAVILPFFVDEKIKNEKEKVAYYASEAEKAKNQAKTSLLKLEELQLEIAREASLLSRTGKIENARQKFSKIANNTSNIQILYLAFEFFNRTGDLDYAKSLLEKWLNLSGPNELTVATASDYGNLGNLYQTKGDLEKAQEMYERSLKINEALGCKEGMANQYGNLGNLYQTKGDLEKAQEMYERSLKIEEALGRKEGMASDYGNLGNLYQTKGDLEKAQEMYERSLKINEALGCKEGMA